MKICILIPVYNESQNIGRIVEIIKRKDLNVIVIDDGSTDGSGDLAQQKGAVVLRHVFKMGKGNSLKEGFEYILKEGYAGVLMMDGDGQHDPEEVDHFILAAQKHPLSVITGNRMTNTEGMPLIRYLTNRFMSSLISTACGQKIQDTQCGFRYISASILRELNLVSNDFEIETEILMKASKKGYKIYSLPIKTIYRNEESYIHPLKDTVRFFTYFLKEIFSR